MKRLRKVIQKVKKKAAEPPYAGCFACGVGKCGYAPPVNTCTCCRMNHTGIR